MGGPWKVLWLPDRILRCPLLFRRPREFPKSHLNFLWWGCVTNRDSYPVGVLQILLFQAGYEILCRIAEGHLLSQKHFPPASKFANFRIFQTHHFSKLGYGVHCQLSSISLSSQKCSGYIKALDCPLRWWHNLKKDHSTITSERWWISRYLIDFRILETSYDKSGFMLKPWWITGVRLVSQYPTWWKNAVRLNAISQDFWYRTCV